MGMGKKLISIKIHAFHTPISNAGIADMTTLNRNVYIT
jgi:hypothetical protein